MGLNFREVLTPDLSADLSNLSELDLTTILNELKGPRHREILMRLQQELLTTAQAGHGVAYDAIQQPFRQTGLECQTMALFNGIVAIGEGTKLARVSSDIGSLVSRVRSSVQQIGLRGETGRFDPDRGSSIDTQANFSMTTVASNLPQLGIPLKREPANSNPIKLTRALFKPKYFMGVGKADAWHGKTIVPLACATPGQFTAELDSLSGTKRAMTLQEFLEMTLNRDKLGRDTFEIYSI